jgi:hypothetical protein
MKKLLALSMLIPLAMVCFCQKQDAAPNNNSLSGRPSYIPVRKH